MSTSVHSNHLPHKPTQAQIPDPLGTSKCVDLSVVVFPATPAGHPHLRHLFFVLRGFSTWTCGVLLRTFDFIPESNIIELFHIRWMHIFLRLALSLWTTSKTLCRPLLGLDFGSELALLGIFGGQSEEWSSSVFFWGGDGLGCLFWGFQNIKV